MNLLTDAERETVIDTYAQLAQAATTSGMRHYWGEQLKVEHKKRSPDQVRKMEREKGLRA